MPEMSTFVGEISGGSTNSGEGAKTVLNSRHCITSKDSITKQSEVKNQEELAGITAEMLEVLNNDIESISLQSSNAGTCCRFADVSK